MVFSKQSVSMKPDGDNKAGGGVGGGRGFPSDENCQDTPNGDCLHGFDSVDDETIDELFWAMDTTAVSPVKTGLIVNGAGDKTAASVTVAPVAAVTVNTSSDVPPFAETFPWLVGFADHCSVEVGTPDIVKLENLMTEFIKLVEPVVKDCYSKPNRAAKLKRCISDTLLFFHIRYSDIKKPLEHSSYLDKMSQLMAFFIDMEFKASSRSKENLRTVANKLIASLYMYLDRSINHVLDSILKTNFLTKSFRELSKMLFSRLLRDSPGRTEDMTYVRYILVFKMWKRVAHGVDERKHVMKMAETKLSPPPSFREKLKAGFLNGVLPKIPKSRADDITLFLMQAMFCPKEKAEAFIKIVSDPKRVSLTLLKIDSRFTVDADNANSSDDLFDEELDLNNSSCDESNDKIFLSSSCSMLSLDTGTTITNSLSKPLDKSKLKKCSTKKGIATPILMESPSQSPVDVLCEKKKRKRLVKNSELSDKVEEVAAQPPTSSSSCEVKQEETKDDDKIVSPPLAPPQDSLQSPPPPLPSTLPASVSAEPAPVTSIKIELDSDESDKSEETSQEVKLEETTKEAEEDANPKEMSEPIDAVLSECIDVKTCDEVIVGEEICEPAEETVAWKDSGLEELREERREPEVRTEILIESQEVNHEIANESCAECSRRDLSVFIKQAEFVKLFAGNSNPTTMEVPSPVSYNTPRCNCSNCEANLENLLGNYRRLLPYTNNLTANLVKGEMKREATGQKESSDPKQPDVIADNPVVTKIPSVSAEVEDLSRQRLDIQPKVTTTPSTFPVPLPVQQERNDSKFVHDATLRRDYTVFMKQSDFRRMFVEKTISRDTEVASPYDADNNGLLRCACPQCENNLKSLLINYRTLLQLKTNNFGGETEVKKTRDIPPVETDEPAREDSKIVVEGDEGLRLPLKKRRAVTTDPDQPPAKKKEILVSYPSTPMLGIAEICEMALRNRPTTTYHLRNPGASQSDSTSQPPVYQRLPPTTTYSAPLPPPSPTSPIHRPPLPASPSAPFRRFMTAAELKAGVQNCSSPVEMECKASKSSKRKERRCKDRMTGSRLADAMRLKKSFLGFLVRKSPKRMKSTENTLNRDLDLPDLIELDFRPCPGPREAIKRAVHPIPS